MYFIFIIVPWFKFLIFLTVQRPDVLLMIDLKHFLFTDTFRRYLFLKRIVGWVASNTDQKPLAKECIARPSVLKAKQPPPREYFDTSSRDVLSCGHSPPIALDSSECSTSYYLLYSRTNGYRFDVVFFQ